MFLVRLRLVDFYRNRAPIDVCRFGRHPTVFYEDAPAMVQCAQPLQLAPFESALQLIDYLAAVRNVNLVNLLRVPKLFFPCGIARMSSH
jgi:hypothetical protein